MEFTQLGSNKKELKEIVCSTCKNLLVYFKVKGYMFLDSANYFCSKECSLKRRVSTSPMTYKCPICDSEIIGYFDSGTMQNMDSLEYGFYCRKICRMTEALVR